MKNIICTIIFDGAALNRDEKIGGNIQSIKKLNIDGSLKSFISRQAVRHYLFNTLTKAYPDDWKPAKITGQGNVAQFDITQDDIFTSAELDTFGYMFTIENEMSITRKAPVGITKAISIGNYNQDMAFYVNHDLVNRANQQGIDITPNPFQREEHNSLYKLSFTIDTQIFGKDVWIVKNEPRYDNNELTVELAKSHIKIIKNVLKNGDYYEVKDANGVNSKTIGKIKIEKLSKDAYKITYELADDIKKKRIKQILESIKNGLVSHSSGEDNTIVPLFMIAGEVTVPSPIFHSYIDLMDKKIIGINDCLNNSWLVCNNQNNNNLKLFIYCAERLQVEFPKEEIIDDWNVFLNKIGL
ncbi:MAG: type I-B CRISPR-associated protein Cas7/Cst2/DevR [Spirochaetales bacterium]|jgi:CRISPR-associated protein Cst2|nr:type I-B CRISPR-associated protein Cas7/Cst2/DevR [Exilispira sp.]NMC66996.1 type I-B CRISPR-associated protein Cas7/Cst2/DevR [Spirochaetales bacterium]